MNNDTRFANQYNIQWFPGHMTKTLRMMETEIQHVDASLVLLDARIPLSSLNPEVERITARKPKLYVLNKADLADPAVTEEWIRYFRAADAGCVAISAKQKGGAKAVQTAIEKELASLLERRQNRGMGGAKTQVMLCGIPNVGKSTFINTFAGVDEGGFAHIGDAAQHYLRFGTAHAAILAALQQTGKLLFNSHLHSVCAALLLGADGHAAGICGVEVADPLLGHSRVGKVSLVQRIELGLAVGDALDLRVQAGKRDARVQQHKAGINVLDLLLHHAQSLGHVAREPLNIVLVCKPGIHFVHFTTPKSVKGIKHNSTLPRISRSSMQPT